MNDYFLQFIEYLKKENFVVNEKGSKLIISDKDTMFTIATIDIYKLLQANKEIRELKKVSK